VDTTSSAMCRWALPKMSCPPFYRSYQSLCQCLSPAWWFWQLLISSGGYGGAPGGPRRT